MNIYIKVYKDQFVDVFSISPIFIIIFLTNVFRFIFYNILLNMCIPISSISIHNCSCQPKDITRKFLYLIFFFWNTKLFVRCIFCIKMDGKKLSILSILNSTFCYKFVRTSYFKNIWFSVFWWWFFNDIAYWLFKCIFDNISIENKMLDNFYI